MSQIQGAAKKSKYMPSVEGIRGYGFLLVFVIHYLPAFRLAAQGSTAYKILTGAEEIAYFAVPMFFVLSGYLIGGILYGTRNREGFFRVFYSRRVIRVIPIYYLALLIIACGDAMLKVHLDYHFWTYFLFIQNLIPDFLERYNPFLLIQYWSLATEEQFYLLWPLAVWFFPQRKRLFSLACVLIVLICGIRFVVSQFISYPSFIRYSSLTRADAILLGVLLALVYKHAIFAKFKPFAKWVALAGVSPMILWAFWHGETWPTSSRGSQLLIPWINFTAVAIVVSVMEEGNWLNRVCSQRWIGWFGRRSYSLYIFHFIYARAFRDILTPYLSRHIPNLLAVLVSTAIAFSLTVLLSILCYELIEKRTQRLKQHLAYGPVNNIPASTVSGQALQVETGA
jgi:peptidoglycan/LPS O-acetylase OafA/YrhL